MREEGSISYYATFLLWPTWPSPHSNLSAIQLRQSSGVYLYPWSLPTYKNKIARAAKATRAIYAIR